jgi:hydrogenase maturation protease
VDHDDVLVIGYGSSLCGDDAAGLLAARRLAAIGYRAIEAHQLTPELAERVAAVRTVIFLDAHAELPPGEVAVRALTATAAHTPLEHHAGPAGLLRLACTVYGAAPRAWMVGMGGATFELGEGLSPDAERAVERAVEEAIRCMNPG